jgi:capsular polysaccharide transport system permease protein
MRITDARERRISTVDVIRSQARVLYALMLRDIKTRWGSSPAYVITFLWPLVHILVLVGIWSALGRVAPYGESSFLWFSISMLPFMACTYAARYLLIGVLHSKPLIAFPLIKITDILFSRILIETLNAFVLILMIIFCLWLVDVDFYPYDIKQAFLALTVSIFLGLGFGIVNGLIGIIFPMWVTGFMLFTIVLWLTSGVMFEPNTMPQYLRDLLYWQPTVHIVEWMREAYYSGYRSLILDKTFIVYYTLATIFFGLAIERFARGRIVM